MYGNGLTNWAGAYASFGRCASVALAVASVITRNSRRVFILTVWETMWT